VERWSRPDADHIHVETLIEDPKFYTKPFTYQRTWLAGGPIKYWVSMRAAKIMWI
jgi:hypothetical protein